MPTLPEAQRATRHLDRAEARAVSIAARRERATGRRA